MKRRLVATRKAGREVKLSLEGAAFIDFAGEEKPRSLVRYEQLDPNRPWLGRRHGCCVRDDYPNSGMASGEVLSCPRICPQAAGESARWIRHPRSQESWLSAYSKR